MTEMMNEREAIESRHAVREYYDRKIEPEALEDLQREISRCNEESGLNMQLVTEEPRAFDSFMAHYGKFSNVRNYIILAGKKSLDLQEKVGYYGERVAIRAQMLGLNTCWVALTFSRRKVKKFFRPASGEKIVCVLALGYGTSRGLSHKSRTHSELCSVQGDMPVWFKEGMTCAMLAPTAMNQQKFRLTLTGPHSVRAEATGGLYSKIDLGIVKYHFEVGAGLENFQWDAVPEKKTAGKRSGTAISAESGPGSEEVLAAASASAGK